MTGKKKKFRCEKCGNEIELITLYAQNHKFFCRYCFEEITGAVGQTTRPPRTPREITDKKKEKKKRLFISFLILGSGLILLAFSFFYIT